MRSVIYSMNVSMDGYIDSPNAPEGWPAPDEELHQYYNDEHARRIDMHIYGRRMYEIMADFWPTADELHDQPAVITEYARMWKAVDKVVFSKTLPEQRIGPNTRLVRGNLAEEVAALKYQNGKDIGVGGATLAAALLQHGLLDEVCMFVTPHIVGGGKPMFQPSDNAHSMSLVETKAFTSGVVLLRYRMAERRE
jgi:dihydrofolate reductase